MFKWIVRVVRRSIISQSIN